MPAGPLTLRSSWGRRVLSCVRQRVRLGHVSLYGRKQKANFLAHAVELLLGAVLTFDQLCNQFGVAFLDAFDSIESVAVSVVCYVCSL